MIAADKPPLSGVYLAHISMRPWSEYSSADYTPEQWHKACLIHDHQGAPTSKSQCKLPVRTPNGALNKNGVHAAMAALNGARGGVQATTEQKMKARSALSGLYTQLGEKPPGFMAKHSDMDDDEVLAHFGRKGMKWGVRNDRTSGGSNSTPSPKPKMSNTKKIAITTTAVVGAAGIAYLLAKRGGVHYSSGGLTNPKSDLYRPMVAGNKAASFSIKKTAKVSDLPPLRKMLTESRSVNAGSAKIPDVATIRQQLSDPNHVWSF